MKFSTKSKNLQSLNELLLKESIVPNFKYFTVQEWQTKKVEILNEVNQFLGDKISIRSSYFLEDNLNSSMAGEFEGFLNVKNNKKKIEILTNKLVFQYKKKNTKKKYFLNSEILYQNFLNNSILSGVVTNYCLKDGSDYYVINYDDSSNKTDAVTSGGEKSSRVIYIYKKNIKGLRSANFLKIIKAIKEIENKISSTPIDVEFAIDKKGKVNIFQIRPLSTLKNWKKFHKKKFNEYLNLYEKKFIKITKENKIFGNKPIFGLMPDWNPAEIIGYHPSKLSYSLYSNLITNNSWAKARKEMGYNYVNSRLMYDFAGKPYIDTRLSFNSLMPNKINKSLKSDVLITRVSLVRCVTSKVVASNVLSASLFWITRIAPLAPLDRYLCCARGRSSSLLLRKNALPSDAEHPPLKGRKMVVETPHLYSRHLSFRFWRIFTSRFPLKLRTKKEVLNVSVKLIHRSLC